MAHNPTLAKKRCQSYGQTDYMKPQEAGKDFSNSSNFYPQDIAYRQDWISVDAIQKVASQLKKDSYGQYLNKILQEQNNNQPSVLA